MVDAWVGSSVFNGYFVNVDPKNKSAESKGARTITTTESPAYLGAKSAAITDESALHF